MKIQQDAVLTFRDFLERKGFRLTISDGGSLIQRGRFRKVIGIASRPNEVTVRSGELKTFVDLAKEFEEMGGPEVVLIRRKMSNESTG